ncbi:unnamed protein product [Prorocentrum cordatum]|uniref:Cellulase n=1 Tax=Prorocentrum cordatum TaxID=2364126 RepID=A0ABN9V8K3_9DINO|nr:unnamed protein product [Polarella glacialis]
MVDEVVADTFELETSAPGVECQNTPGWANGWSACAYQQDGHNPKLCRPIVAGAPWPNTRGWTCAAYREKGWCANGTAVGIPWWARGGYPSRNCCSCGGGKVIADESKAESPPSTRPAAICQADTGGTCGFTSSCHSFRGEPAARAAGGRARGPPSETAGAF